MTDLQHKILTILDGIDRDELDSRGGLDETSTCVAFGKDIISQINEAFNSETNYKQTALFY